MVCAAITACTTLDYDLPPVADSGGDRQPGKFIWHDLISDDPAASEAFYGALFGWEFRSLKVPGAGYWIISLDGEQIGGMVNQAGLPAQRDISQWVSVLSVEDTGAVAASVRESGGSVLQEPVSLGSRGTIAVFADAQGAIFAGLTSAAGDPPDRDRLPAEGAFLWHELWTRDAVDAARFYAQLSALSIEVIDGVDAAGNTVPFSVLRDGERARAGVRPLPDADIPSLWMPYLRVADRARLEQLLGDAPQLGGRVLVPVTPRPAGGFVAVIAGPSGAPVALQTWGDDQKLKEGNRNAD
jgi:predicted enzyme related to lactoylglutathione lyase